MPVKLTPEEHLNLLRAIATRRKGKCLSEQYIKSSIKLKWQCEHGHEWEATPNKIKQGRWCHICNNPPKVTIEQMQQIATSRNGKCLTSNYVNAKSKLLWQCENGHNWEATPDKIKRGSWCPVCNKPEKGTLEQMHQLAQSRNGQCLSTKYINTDTKLKWRCENGHEWQATPSKVKQQKTWCPTCAGNKKITLEEVQRVAQKKGGLCLSTSYANNSSPLKWRCQYGHEWKSQYAVIKSGAWCPECAGNAKLKLENIIKLIEERGGKCLSTTMKNSVSKLKVECEHGHIWYPTAATLSRNHWCRTCAGSEPLGILKMKKIAASRGGKCLSTVYTKNSRRLEWECAEGHRWKTSVSSITNGSWCPECSSGLGERITKAHFEHLFQKKFKKTRPQWLVNSRGNSMELDGYNEELKLAFEHQGEQHFSLKTHFIRTHIALQQRKLDDIEKLKLCKKHGIHLIQVPEVPSRLKINELKEFIRAKCLLKDMKIPETRMREDVDLSDVYNVRKHLLLELQEICSEKNGECISDQYVFATTELNFRCSYGHEWTTTPFQIRNGSWCHVCGTKKSSDSRRSSIESLQELALSQHGKLLSTSYDHGNQKLLWQCNKGHQWVANPTNIRAGKWCPICSQNLTTLEDVKSTIEIKHGKLISCEFRNQKSDITIQCPKGHQWTTKVSTIMRGSWCMKCAVEERTTANKNDITKVQELAKSKNGRLLSSAYKNNTSLLEWQCAEGHKWEASYAVTIRGRWCSICRKKVANAEALKNYKKIASSHDGECLSDTYINAKTKLHWQCKRGHNFFATPDNVKQGKWCPYCRGS